MKKGISCYSTRVLLALMVNLLLFSCDKKEVTPTVSITSFSPTTVLTGASVIITGANFSTTVIDNLVKFNGKDAVVTAASTTQLTATVPADATSGKISVSLNGVTAVSADELVVLQPPTITSFSPAEGTVGTTVTITGTNFSTAGTENVVKFNGTDATVTAATATQLSVTVPAGATTGKVSVLVNGVTVMSTVDFTVHPTPEISSFVPINGVVGTTVTITGTNFSPVASNNMVKFNGIAATVTAASSTELTTKVPAGAATGKITILAYGVTVTSASDFVVLMAPTVTSFAPATGTVGVTITITGTNFSTVAEDNVVKFNGTIAMVTAASSTELTTTVPSGASSGKISVSVNGLEVVSQNDFVVPPPSITSFAPASGPVGASVLIIGTNFSTVASSNEVRFNGTLAEVTDATATQLTVTVPQTDSGPITVTVSNNTATSGADFTFIPPPAISHFYPAYYDVSDPLPTIKITGTNFSTVPTENIVKFNGVVATVTEATAEYLKVDLPASATTGFVTVNVNGQTATSSSEYLIGCPDAHTANLTISNVVDQGALYAMDIDFDIENIGSIPLSISQLYLKGYVGSSPTLDGSSSQLFDSLPFVSGVSLIMPGMSVHISYTQIQGVGNLTPTDYFILEILSNPVATKVLVECSDTNNEASTKVLQ